MWSAGWLRHQAPRSGPAEEGITRMEDNLLDQGDGVEGSFSVAPDRQSAGVWHLGPRDLPLPVDVSDELRDERDEVVEVWERKPLPTW